jgi:hypothetical protein
MAVDVNERKLFQFVGDALRRGHCSAPIGLNRSAGHGERL